MVERNTRVRSSAIKSILPNDLEATNARVDNYIPSYDEAEEKYTWVPNAAGASNIEDLGDVDFDSGTPIDGYSLVYDDATSKWKAELISGGDFSDGGEAGGADRKIGNTDNYDLSLLTNNLSRIHIQNDGKVGIGETTPGAKLDVNGDLILQNGTSIDEFSIDGLLAGNSDDAIPTEKAVKTYSDVIDAKTVKNQDNMMINAFRIAVNGSLSQFGMIDNIVDEYEDESGIDTVNSLNESYNSANDYYSPSKDSLTVSPYAHMKMENNTDDGTGANAVTDIGTPTYTLGKLNNALTLDGATDALNVNALALDITSDTTGSLAFWIYPDDVTTLQSIFTITDASADPGYFMVDIINGKLRAIIEKDGSNRWFLLNQDITISEWSHWVIVQDGVSAKIYKNGTDVTGSFTLAGSYDGSEWLSPLSNIDTGRIGCMQYNGGANERFFDGQIDDFRYYQNKALTQAEVNVIYNSGTGTEADKPEGDTENMTLISDTFTAEAAPDTARAVILEEDIDAISLNTDLKAWASRDSGANWVQGTLSDEGDYDASKRILVADFTLAGSGTNMEYKLTTHNTKDLKIHASALNWD